MEEAVARYLERRGLTVLGRNVRLGYLEVDLVALDGRTVAVVEVRYRGERSWTTAFGSINQQKRRRLRRAGWRLWRRYFRRDPRVDHLRFDAATVVIESGGALRVEYAPGAF
jgi:putative endonuclease